MLNKSLFTAIIRGAGSASGGSCAAYAGSKPIFNINRLKKIAYKYDLISGKVNEVYYQPGAIDQFYHRYEYDAENRLTDVYTSDNKVYIGHKNLEEHEAFYEYYKHGPLARAVIGQQQVQGIDYAYTLEGWLKGVNSTALIPVYDMGGDGNLIARDAYTFSLNYFTGDYKPINSTVSPFPGFSGLFPTGYSYKPLYNGNISAMTVNIGKLNNPLLYNYQYDQLNRLVAMDAFSGLNETNNTWNALTTDNSYQERTSYDANGNILTYKRNGDAARLSMDNLTYTYKPATNQLDKVTDAAPDAAAGDYDKYKDIKQGQQNGNYQYDSIGNLISDASEGISNIEWTVYGKIKSVTKTDGNTVAYTYDAAGNRISKTVTPASGTAITTWYMRDATGNVMAVYTTKGSDSLYLEEQDLYGSSRLGVYNRNINADEAMPEGMNANLIGQYLISYFNRGYKNYELNNHLGNVLATVSDKKFGVDANGDGVVDNYYSDVVSVNDYYPFGMMMPGRKYSIANTNYRYGFNGKELDKEVSATTTYDYGFRIYSPGLGRFLSVDRLAPDYPWYSPYHFAGGNPIAFNDLDGLEPKTAYDNWRPNTKKAGLKYWYGEDYKGYEDLNLRQVVDNDKKIYWVISENSPGGVIYGEYNWKWYDSKTKKWLSFQPVGYESAKQIANSMKGADKMLLGIFGGAIAAPLIAVAAPEIVTAAGGADAIGSYFAKKSIDASIELFGQLSNNHFDISKVDWADVATNYLPINEKWNVFIKATIKNVVGASIDYSEEKGWRIAGLNKDITTAAVEGLVGTVSDGIFGKVNKELEKQFKKAGLKKGSIEKRMSEIVKRQNEAVEAMIKNAVIEKSTPNKED